MANSAGYNNAPFTFIWTIENYRQPPYLKLQSPSFTAYSIYKTKWRLVLHVNQHCVLCYIKRQIDKSVTKSMELDFELAVLTSDGTPAFLQKDVYFRINPHSKIVPLIENSVLNQRRAEFLPNDTLTIRCQIRRRYFDLSTTDLCFTRTQLRDERIIFIWPVDQFSSLLPGHKRNYSFQATVTCGFTLTLSLYLDHDDDMLCIEILAIDGRYCGIKVKISVIDNEGKTVHSAVVENRIHSNEAKILFPPFFAKKELMFHKDMYFRKDTLILRCEFDIFAGTRMSQIEYCLQSPCANVDVDAMPDHPIDKNSVFCQDYCSLHMNSVVNGHAVLENKCDINGNSVSCNDYCTLKMILKCVEEKRIICDLIIQNGIQSFQVHKNILCARCPILEAMFSSDIMEDGKSVANVCNLNKSALRHLLFYIYTDTLADVCWKDVLDLFCAANEYGLRDLKKRCTILLKANFNKSNVFEIMSFANEHQDENLIFAAKDFIFQQAIESGGIETGNVFKKCRKRIGKGIS